MSEEQNQQPTEQPEQSKRKRGRPKGSKTKRPLPVTPAVDAVVRAMSDMGLSVPQIQETLESAKANRKDVLRTLRSNKSEEKPEDVETAKARFTSELQGIVGKLLTAANTDSYAKTLSETKNASLTLAIAQMIDKYLLLNGKPTEITESRQVANEVMTELERIRKEREELKRALGGNVESAGN